MSERLPSYLASSPSLWASKDLLIPVIPRSLENELEHYEWGLIATIRKPQPLDDYMFTPSIAYLALKVPDQYVLSYAGHGVNSYSANFRFAYGGVAIMFQIGFGGYTDPDSSAKAWNEAVRGFEPLAQRYLSELPDEGTRHRRELFCYSNFRNDFKIGNGSGPTLLTRAGGNRWEPHTTYESWDRFRHAQVD